MKPLKKGMLNTGAMISMNAAGREQSCRGGKWEFASERLGECARTVLAAVIVKPP